MVFILGAIPVQEVLRGRKPSAIKKKKKNINSIELLAKCFLHANAFARLILKIFLIGNGMSNLIESDCLMQTLLYIKHDLQNLHSSAVYYNNTLERCGITLTPAEMNRDCDYNGARCFLVGI